jgi:FAD/FMN-containing dehydrogenase
VGRSAAPSATPCAPAGPARSAKTSPSRSPAPRLTAAAREIGERHGLDVASFGHAGDGNLHVNILYDPAAPDVHARVDRAVAELFKITIDLGGTLSGEHGIGLSKRPYMPLEQSAPLRALQLDLKRAWDPRNILNPGKIFPPA